MLGEARQLLLVAICRKAIIIEHFHPDPRQVRAERAAFRVIEDAGELEGCVPTIVTQKAHLDLQELDIGAELELLLLHGAPNQVADEGSF